MASFRQRRFYLTKDHTADQIVMLTSKRNEIADLIYTTIAHGDDNHKQWLKQKSGEIADTLMLRFQNDEAAGA